MVGGAIIQHANTNDHNILKPSIGEREVQPCFLGALRDINIIEGNFATWALGIAASWEHAKYHQAICTAHSNHRISIAAYGLSNAFHLIIRRFATAPPTIHHNINVLEAQC